jgi:uncharacterized Ntn-hydrolase superfamily protein
LKHFICWTPLTLLLAAFGCASHRPASVAPAITSAPPVATFSIVGVDPATGEIGIATQSKIVSVGSVVPWAEAGIGAVATQAWANTTYGPKGLVLLRDGATPKEAIEKLLADDPGRDARQVAIIDAKGNSFAYTGAKCLAWAGSAFGPNCVAVGNILAGEKVATGMIKGFGESDGDLGDRLIAALRAGQSAGGDKRGRQSAALLIVRQGAGYAGFNDRYRDVRVDEHTKPIEELARVYDLHRKAFPAPKAK